LDLLLNYIDSFLLVSKTSLKLLVFKSVGIPFPSEDISERLRIYIALAKTSKFYLVLA